MARRDHLWHRLLLLAAPAVCLFASITHAATFTWNSAGTDPDWFASSNWYGSVPGSGDVGLFPSAAYAAQPTLSSTAAVGGIWDTGAGSLAIGGAVLSLFGTTINGNPGAGIEIDAGAGSLTINAPLVLQNNQQWINNSASPFALNGNVSGAGSLTLAGSGVLTMTGISTATGPLIVNGGTLALNAENIVQNSGGVVITNATVQTGYFNPFYYPPAGVPQITINAGGLLTQTAPDNVNLAAVTLNGGTLSSNGLFDSFYGSYFLQQGTIVTVTGSATSTISALAITGGGPQTFNVAAGSTLNVTGYFSDLYGTFGLAKTGPGTMILAGPNTYTGFTTVDGGTLKITSGSDISLTQYVGFSGTGSVTQCGGSNSPSIGLYLGYYPGSCGSYILTGSGLLSAQRVEQIGVGGRGAFVQNGGANAVYGELDVGFGGYGTYCLSGSGVLTVSTEYIGNSGSGVFTQTGGTNSASFLGLSASGGTGTYNLYSGLLQVNGGLETNGGTLNFGGGSATIIAGSNSIVDLSASILNTGSASLAIGPNSLLIVPPGFNPASAFGSYSNLGLTHTLGSTLNVPAGSGFGGRGTIADPVVCQGAILALPGGAINLGNGLTLSGAGQVNLGSGTLTVNDPLSGMSPGAPGAAPGLAVASMIVGSTGAGTFTQSSGTNTVANYLYLGINAGSSGSYSLSGSTGAPVLTAANEYVGFFGSGSFTQTGGSNSTPNLSFGVNPGSSGTYNLSGSTGAPVLTVQSEYIGYSGNGSFAQSGGTHSVTYLDLGENSGGSGTYCLRGTGLFSTNSVDIGVYGNGAFTQSGGTSTVANTLLLGVYAGSSGSYSLHGSGLLSAPNVLIGDSGSGIFAQSGGTHSVGTLVLGIYSGSSGTYSLCGSGLITASNEYVGGEGSGVFTQSGGINVALGAGLYVGSDGPGSYNLSGSGMLWATDEYIGGQNGGAAKGNGSFTQSGGTHAVAGELDVGYYGSGSYSLGGSGAPLLTAATEYIGNGGTGVFTQTGGTHSVSFLALSVNGGSGTYNLDGGLLQINGGLTTAGGTLNFGGAATIVAGSDSIVDLSGSMGNTGSTSLSIGANSLLIVPPGLNTATAFGSYSNLGLSYTLGSTLNVPAGTGFGGFASIADPVVCQGSILASPSGAINLNNGLSLSGTGQVNLGSGTLTINDPLSGMSPGAPGAAPVLAVASMIVGSTGSGTFTQSGGTNSVANYLYLGNNAGSNGSYSLSAAAGLFVGSAEIIGVSGSGSFTQSGGANSAGSALYLGNNPGSSGSYNLSGIGLLTTDTEYIGYLGTGSFTQSGGTHSVANNLYLGYYGNGTYCLAGSGLLAAAYETIGYSGSGSFAQSGGTNAVSAELDLLVGSYSLTGNGMLTAPGEYIFGGCFKQSGGTHAVSNALYVGYNGSGSYHLGGSGLLTAPVENIGWYGTGCITQSGGTNVVGSALFLAMSNGDAGTYNLNGGLLSLFGSGLTAGGGSAAFNFSGGTFQAASSLTIDVPITLSTAGSNGVFDTMANTLALASPLSGSGGFQKIGAGTLVLTASNGFTGTALVANGTLLLGNASALAGSTFDTSGGGSLSFGTLTGAFFGGLQGSGGLALNNTASAAVSLSVGGYNANSTFTGVLSGSGSLTKVGSGTIVFGGNNSYTGGTTVAAGTLLLDFSQPGAPTANILNNSANVPALTLSGGALAMQGNVNAANSQSLNGLAVNPGASAVVLTAAASNSLVLSLGSISRSPGGMVDFTLPSGPQSAANGITTTTPNTTAGVLGGYATVGGGINWASSAGTNGMAGNITAYNAYTTGDLGILLSNATLNVLPTGSQTAVTTADSFSTLNLAGTVGIAMTGAGSLTLVEGGLIGNTSGAVSGGTLTGPAGGDLVVITPQSLTISSVIADNPLGPTALTKAGSATLTLSAADSFTGVTLLAGGTLLVANSAALAGSTFDTSGQGTLSLGTQSNAVFGGLQGSGNFALKNMYSNALALTVGGNNASTTFSGNLSGPGGLTKIGAGALTVSGTSSFGGNLTIDGGTLQFVGGSLVSPVQYVGYSAAGSVIQSSATNSAYNGLYLGYNAGSSGTYALSGSGLVSASFENIGYSGGGGFTQSAGANSAYSSLYLGYSAGGTGSYLLAGGTLSTPGENVGVSGSGSFAQSGGTNAVNLLFLGSNIGGSGTYTLSGSGLLSALVEYVGYSGGGGFTQSGGTNAANGLNIGNNIGSSGVYTLGGSGRLSAGFENIGAFGSGGFTQSGGTNVVTALTLGNNTGGSGTYTLSGNGRLAAGSETIGLSGTGSFTQSGGTNSASINFYLANSVNGRGAYNLTGGSLSAASEYIGNVGIASFTQSGGANSLSQTLYVGANSNSNSGTYSLSGAGILSAHTEDILGSGTFTQSGGTNTLSTPGTLLVGSATGPSATYNLNGGLLNLGGLTQSGGNAAFNFGGGTLGATAPWATPVNVNLTGVGGPATVNTTGAGPGGIGLGGLLSGTGGLTKAGSGVLALSDPFNSFTGNVTVAGGTLAAVNTSNATNPTTSALGNPQIAGRTITIGSGATLAVNTSNLLGGASANNDSIPLAIAVNGGTLLDTVPGANNLIGPLTLSGGTVTGVSGNSNGLYLTWQLGGAAETVTVTGSASSLLTCTGTYQGYNMAATTMFNVGNTNSGGADLTVSAPLSDRQNALGPATLVKSGPGLMLISASCAYSGGTVIDGGVISIHSDANLGAAPAAVQPGNITLNGGAIEVTAATAYDSPTIKTNRGISLGASGGTINVAVLASGTFASNESAVNYAGVMSGQGSLVVTGGGGTNSGTAPYLLELGGQSTFGGPTTISNATVSVMNTGGTGPNNVLPATTVLNLVHSGWFVLDNGTAKQTLAGLSGDASGRIGGTNGSNSVTLTIAPSTGQTYNFAGVIGAVTLLGKAGSNVEDSLVIAGSGMQILSGANTYAGGTTITGGTLALSGPGTLGAVSGGLTLGGGALDLGGGSQVVGAVTITAAPASGNAIQNGTLTGASYAMSNSAGNVAVTANLQGAGASLTKAGMGMLTLTAVNTYSGATTVNGGTLNMPGGSLASPTQYVGYSATGGFMQSGGTNAAASNLYLGYNAGSSGAYFLGGAGAPVLTAPNEYIGYSGSGSFTQSGGVNVNDPLYLGFNAGSFGTYNLTGGSLLTESTEYIGYAGSGSFTQTGGTNSTGSLVLAQSVGSYGVYYLNGGLLLVGSGGITQGLGNAAFNFGAGTLGTTAPYSSSINLALTGSGNSTIDTTGGNIALAGILSGSGGLNKVGPGALSLSGPNTYGGATSVLAGTLLLANASALQNSTISVQVDNGLQFLPGIGTFNLGGLAGGNVLTLSDTAGSAVTLNVGGNAATTTYSGNIGGNGGLVKVGTGMLTLSGSNGFSGGATISGGALSFIATASVPGAGVITIGPGGALVATPIYNPAAPVSSWLARGAIAANPAGAMALPAGAVDNESIALSATASGLSLGAIGSATYGGTLTTAGSTVYLGGGGGNLYFTSSLSGSGSLAVGTRGLPGGSVILTGVNALGGTLVVDGGTLQLPSGSLTMTASGSGNEYIGNSATASFIQSGGTHAVFGNLYLGYAASGNGSYSLGGSGQLAASSEYIGYSGSGAFTQTAGTNTIATALYLGQNPGSVGSYNLLGGVLSVTNVLQGSGSGSLNVSGGSVTAATGAILVNTPIVLTTGSNGTFDTSSSSLTLAGQISGAGGLTKTGSAALVLAAGNTYTGPTTVAQGTLLLTNSNAAQYTTVSVAADNGLQFGSGVGSFNIGALGGAGNLALADTGGNAVTAITGGNNSSTTYTGQISGPGTLVHGGSGVLFLTGTNSYTGGTVLTEDAAPGGLIVTSQASFVGPLTFAGNNRLGFAASMTATNSITVNGGVTGSIDTLGNTVVLSGLMSGAGTLNKIDSGTLILSGSNSLSGSLAVSQGTLQLANAAAAGTSTLAVYTDNGLQFSPGVGAFNAGGLSGSGALSLADIAGGPVTLTFGGNNQNTTYIGQISGSGALVKDGAGTSTFTGSNTFTGSLTLDPGVVAINSNAALGAATSPVLFTGGGTLAAIGPVCLSASRCISINSGVIATLDPGGSTLTVGGVISGSGGLAVAGGGTLVLANSNTYCGGTAVNGGALEVTMTSSLPGAFTPGNVNIAYGAMLILAVGGPQQWSANNVNSLLAVPELFSLGASFGLDTSGGAFNPASINTSGIALALTGSNAFAGVTNISQGTLQLANAAALVNSTVAINADNALRFIPGIGTFTLGGLSGNNLLTLSDVDGGPVALEVGGNNASTSFGGTIAGNGSLIKMGNGNLVLSGMDVFTGGMFVESGELTLQSAESLAAGSSLMIGDTGLLFANGESQMTSDERLPSAAIVTPVPEPGTIWLAVAGIAAVAVARRLRDER